MLVRDPHKLCRFCLTSGEELIDIFCSSNVDLSPSLNQRINLCLPIKVYPSDIFPTKLCPPCLESFDKLYKFWLQTESSEKRLSELFSSGPRVFSDKDQQFGGQHRIQDEADWNKQVQNSEGDESLNSCQLLSQEVCPSNTDAPLRKTSETENVSICTSCSVHQNDSKYQPSSSYQTPCSICNQISDTKSSRDSRKYVCSVCDYSNASLSNFKIHLMKHNGDYVARCQYCDKGFYSRTSCTEHELVKHKEECPVTCGKCSKSYHSKAYLRLHMKTHLPDFKNDGFQCDKCGKTFKSSKGARRHKMVDHVGRLYRCDVCDKEIKSLDSLKNHIKIHRGEKPLACPSCGKAFRTKRGLSVHERIHTGSKPYKCSICQASFTQSSSLKIHVRYHKGDMPFQCNDCGKRYVTSTLLNTHQLKHDVSSKK